MLSARSNCWSRSAIFACEESSASPGDCASAGTADLDIPERTRHVISKTGSRPDWYRRKTVVPGQEPCLAVIETSKKHGESSCRFTTEYGRRSGEEC